MKHINFSQPTGMRLSQWLQLEEDEALDHLKPRQKRALQAKIDAKVAQYEERIDTKVRTDHANWAADQATTREHCRELESEAKRVTEALQAGLVDPEAATADLRQLFRGVRGAQEELQQLREREEETNEYGTMTAAEYESEWAERFPALAPKMYLAITDEDLDR